MKILINILLLVFTISVLAVFGVYADKMKKRTVYFCLAGIILLGFILRIATVFLIPCVPVSDYNTMFSAGVSVAEGGKPFTMGSYFQRFPHMTTFSALCGFLMKVFGKDVITIKIFSVLFKTVAIFAAALIGKELKGRKGMLSSAFLYSVFLPDIFYTPVVASENFALTFILFAVYFYIKAYKCENNNKSSILMLYCGMILSAGCLLRGVAPFYLAAFSGGIILCFKTFKKKFLSIVALLASFLLIFNFASLVLYHSGISEYKLSDKGEPYIVYILVGSNFETNGMYSSEDHGVYLDAGEDPQKASEIAKEKLIERLKSNPDKILPLLINKTKIIWSDASFNSVYWSMVENGEEADNLFYPVAQSMCKTMYNLLLILSVLFLVLYNKRLISFMLLLLPLAFEGGLMLMEIQPRYTFSIAYIFAVFAAIGACVVIEKFTERFGEADV